MGGLFMKQNQSIFGKEHQDMPIGFGMALSENLNALEYFSSLNDQAQKDIISYIRGANSGPDAKQRIRSAVNMLENGQSSIESFI